MYLREVEVKRGKDFSLHVDKMYPRRITIR